MMLLSKTSQDVLSESKRYEDDDMDDKRASHEAKDEQEGSTSNASDSNSKAGSSRLGTPEDDLNMIKDRLGREDTKNVVRMRVLMMLILGATGFSLACILYQITTNTETEAFESTYEGNAQSLLESLSRKWNIMIFVRQTSKINACISRGIVFSSVFRCRRSHVFGGWPRRNSIGRR